jgi:hypothetical protein
MPPEVHMTSIAEIRPPLALRLGAEHVALVRFGAAFFLFVLQSPGAVRRELDAALETPGFDETADVGLDLVVCTRRAHDLERAFDVREAWRRTFTADLEQP